MNAHAIPLVSHEATVRQFVEIICEQAQRAFEDIDDPGYLQLVRIHPAQEGKAASQKFRIDDVDGLTCAALQDAAGGHNVYIEGRTVPRNAEKRGKLSDTRGVFALVVDSDADKGRDVTLQVIPSLIVETSPGNRHLWFFLERAVSADEARGIGDAIRAATSGDSDTGVVTQPYRVAGTPNFPGPKKIKRGRYATPTSIVQHHGVRWSADALRETFPKVKPPPQPEVGQATSLPWTGANIELLLAELATASMDRSAQFQRAANDAFRHGMSASEFEELARQHPEGCAQKFLYPRDRLGEEVDRSWRKAAQPHQGGGRKSFHNRWGGGAGDNDNGGSPIIRVVASELPRVVDEAEDALIKAGVPILARGGLLVEPIQEETPAAGGRMTSVARLRVLPTPALVDYLAQVATFQRYDARTKDWINVDPPTKVAETLLAREGRWRFPAVAGVITTPTLRPDGTLLDQPGYDPATRLYLMPAVGFHLPDIPASPTREDAIHARDFLFNVLTGFPFVGEVDRAVALSGILTAVVRPAVEAAPMHVILANTPGTGKSYLVDMFSTIATGRPCPVMAIGKSEEETEKRLGAMLLSAAQLISLDNVNGELGGDFLCLASQRPTVRIRILGLSQSPEVECRAALFATGNNITVCGDMVRRAVLCRLDARVERPEFREFPFDPIERVLRDRSAYVAAALTILRSYQAAKSPDLRKALASYGAWSDMVRSALVWLGEADPVDSMESIREDDPELSSVRELFSQWREHLLESAPYRTSQVIAVASERDGGGDLKRVDFHELLLGRAGQGAQVDATRLGKWLSKLKGRVVEGYRLEVERDGSHGNKFVLRRFREVSV